MKTCLTACGTLIGLCLVLPEFAAAQFDNPAASAAAAPAGGPRYDKPVTQQWKTGVVIRAVGGPCGNLSGNFPVPLEWPEQQVKLVQEEISPHFRGVNYRTTDGLVKQALFAINLLNANDTATMRLTFDVTNYVQVAPANPAEYVIPKTVPAAMRKYLGPSPLIESTNIKFKNLAKDVTEGKETAWEQVVAIADRVHEKVKFERDRSKMKGAAVALTDGKGDREDVIGVFVAACRAHKIPARMVWIPDSCYAEFYLENAAGEGHWFPCQLVGDKEVGFLTERKPILQKGDNIRVPEQKDAQRFVPEFLTGKGKSGGRPDVEFVRRLEGQP